uniref:Uncharacterized protein n=1 Tax=Cucumis sativus TaxID=3659 RepID=A0A0A0K3H1_CUCSA
MIKKILKIYDYTLRQSTLHSDSDQLGLRTSHLLGSSYADKFKFSGKEIHSVFSTRKQSLDFVSKNMNQPSSGRPKQSIGTFPTSTGHDQEQKYWVRKSEDI